MHLNEVMCSQMKLSDEFLMEPVNLAHIYILYDGHKVYLKGNAVIWQKKCLSLLIVERELAYIQRKDNLGAP